MPEVYSALLEHCTDICCRNGIRKLVCIADREKTLSYVVKPNEMILPLSDGLPGNHVRATG